MNSPENPSACPSQAELVAFAHGNVVRADFHRIAGHLEQCTRCEISLDHVDHDTDPALAGLAVSSPVGHDLHDVPESLVDRAQSLRRPTAAAGEQRVLGKFRLLEELGSGSFGSVYRALDTELDRVVAIKVLRAGSLATAEEVESFQREARSAAQLKHPGIVLLYGTGVTADGIYYLVEEFVPGGSLADHLHQHRLDPDAAARIAADVSSALAYAHGRGVIHRDVKPSNIVLDPAGKPHLMDFGLAKREVEEPPATPHGLVLGTPAYMSPEQARGDSHRVDARSDVYSLGVILYELLTGQRPFPGNRQQQLRQVLEDEPRPPRELDHSLARDLETVCLKAMEKSPPSRYASAAEMGQDLERYLDREPILARRVRAPERLWRWCRRNPVAVSLLLAVTLGSAGGLWHLSRLSTDLVRRSALEGAEMQATILEEVNAHYTSNVVGRLPPDVKATHDYALSDRSVPLPATFLTELGHAISATESGMQVRHYSDFPFRSRTNGGPRDAFGRDALAFFREGAAGEEPVVAAYSRFVEDFEGRPALRYAHPRTLQTDCVGCHNEHPDSTKKDWKVGEVVGVLEIIRPLRGDTERARKGLQGTFTLMAVIVGLLAALSVAVAVAGHRRRGPRVTGDR